MSSPTPDRSGPSQPFYALAIVIGIAWSVAALLGGAILASWFLAERSPATPWYRLTGMTLVGAAYLLPLVAYWKSVRAGAYRRKLALGWKIVSVLTWGALLLLPVVESSASFSYYAGLVLPLGCWVYGVWRAPRG